MQAMYPERMVRCFVINAPSFFTMLWRAMDPLLTDRVKSKISIFKSVRPCYSARQLRSTNCPLQRMAQRPRLGCCGTVKVCRWCRTDMTSPLDDLDHFAGSRETHAQGEAAYQAFREELREEDILVEWGGTNRTPVCPAAVNVYPSLLHLASPPFQDI